MRATLLSSSPPPYLSRPLTLRYTQLPKRLEHACCHVTEALCDLLLMIQVTWSSTSGRFKDAPDTIFSRERETDFIRASMCQILY